MGLPPTPASTRLAACTPGPLCLSTYIYTPSFFFFIPFLPYLYPSHFSPAFSPSPSPEEKRQEINLPNPHLHSLPLSFLFLPPFIAALHFVSFLVFVFFSPLLICVVLWSPRRLTRNWYCFSTAGCFFTSHEGLLHILPRPQEMLTDEPHDNVRTRVNTRTRTHIPKRLSPLLPGVSEKTRRPPPPALIGAKRCIFFSPLPLRRCCFSSHPSPLLPPLHPTLFFFLSSFRKWMSSSIPFLPPPQLPMSPPGKPQPKPRFCLFKYLICKLS